MTAEFFTIGICERLSEKHDCKSTFSRRWVNIQVGAKVGNNIEIKVRVESKKQVLPVFGILIVLEPVKFIFILPLGGSVELLVRSTSKHFSFEIGNLSIINIGCLHSGINGHKDSWLNNSTYFPGK
ncbi:hypothetical protein [Tychonema sp. LEGE 07203]|uniref:hypothetical protein n=1 Tax=Tychonema sp. LEGE 07203 TaxID=1828671 RepID=UPI001882DCD3|nr:hypothetical protein [Tychonema sp. LEGE 07203]MBE9096087.1 hypothetical protein [Tychonema sp. LEGE 07203]